MEKIYNVLLDTKDDVKNPSFVVNTNDLKTVKINVLINQDGDPLDLTGATVRLAVKKPDKTTVLQDITVVDALAGSCEIVLNTQAYVIDGKYDAEVMVYFGVDTVAVTGKFSYKAVKGILDDGTIESTNEWQSITQAIADNAALLNELQTTGTGVDAQARADLAGVTTSLSQIATPQYRYIPKNTTASLLSEIQAEKNKTPRAVLYRSTSLVFFELARRINKSGGNITLRLVIPESQGNLTFVVHQMDEPNWVGSSVLSKTFTQVSTGVYETTVSPSEITLGDCIGFGVRINNTEPISTYCILSDIKIIQDSANLTDNSVFTTLGGLTNVNPGSISADYGYRIYLKPSDGLGAQIVAPRIVYVAPYNGLTSGTGKTKDTALSWNYFADTFYPANKDSIDYVLLNEGTYRLSNRQHLLYVDRNLKFIAPDGAATFICGTSFPVGTWTPISTGFYSINYDVAGKFSNFRPNVEAGTQQPYICLMETGTKSNIRLVNATSQANCQATSNSYWYDFTNKKFYVNFGATDNTYNIYIPEVQYGFSTYMETLKLTFVNIEIRGAEQNGFNLAPTNYNNTSGKIEVYNCTVNGTAINDAYHIQNYDIDLINCTAIYAGNDNFNFHFNGVQRMANCEARGAYNDGFSNHENCIAYLWNYRALHNGTTATVPAYGAYLYCENGYSEDNGFDNPRTYSGGFAVVGGQGYAQTTAIYVNCASKNDERGIAGDISSSTGIGEKSSIVANNCNIINPATIGYFAGSSTDIVSIKSQGMKTTSGSNITFVA